MYEYVGSAPTVFVDPMGMLVEICDRPLTTGETFWGRVMRALGFKHSYIQVTSGGEPTTHGFMPSMDGGPGQVTDDRGSNQGGASHGTPRCRKARRSHPYGGGAAGGANPPTGSPPAGGGPKPGCGCDGLSPREKRCCEMTDEQIEECVTKNIQADMKARANGDISSAPIGYVCGDWAKDMLDRCCLEGGDVSGGSRIGSNNVNPANSPYVGGTFVLPISFRFW